MHVLKSTINLKHNIDNGKYQKVKASLNRGNEGYVPKKSFLKRKLILKFMNDAFDEIFVLTKVSTYLPIQKSSHHLFLRY